MSDGQLHDMFAAELADRDAPPLGSLVDDALTRGRRSRRRRLILEPAAALAAISLIVGLSVGLRPGTGHANLTAFWTPSVPPQARVAVPDSTPTTWQAAVYELRSALPDGHSLDYSGGEGLEGGNDALLGILTLSVGAPDRQFYVGLAPHAAPLTCGPKDLYQVCATVRFGTTTVRVLQINYPSSTYNSTASFGYVVSIRYADGFQKAIGEDGSMPTGPILSVAQLYQIIDDPIWDMTMPRWLVDQAGQIIQNQGSSGSHYSGEGSDPFAPSSPSR